MTFNTMCDFCHGSNFFDYEARANAISQIINKHQPDIFALQEVRSKPQIEMILSPFSKYKFVLTEGLFLSYADPTIVYDKNKFFLLETKNYWLGPKKDEFNFGWKFALPRQVIVAKFKRKKDLKEFYFLSAHFDNRIENLKGAALLVNKLVTDLKKPVIFAADTNITTDMDSYKILISKIFINSFKLKEKLSHSSSIPPKDLCYSRKGDHFPSCRVDHILLSHAHSWQVNDFIIDTTKSYGGKYPSDHRPVIVELTF